MTFPAISQNTSQLICHICGSHTYYNKINVPKDFLKFMVKMRGKDREEEKRLKSNIKNVRAGIKETSLKNACQVGFAGLVLLEHYK